MSDRWLEYLRDPDPWTAPSPLPGACETERLVVRRYERGDGPRLFRTVHDHRESILPWMVWSRGDYDEEADGVFYVEKFRRAALSPGCTDFPLAICCRDSGQLIGATGLHDVQPGLKEAEIGYWIGGPWQGEGLCTEAVAGLIGQALTAPEAGGWGLRRLVVYNAVANIGSRRVCQKLGLRLEARQRRSRHLHPDAGGEGYYDSLCFAVLADEWDFEAGRAKPGIGWDTFEPE